MCTVLTFVHYFSAVLRYSYFLLHYMYFTGLDSSDFIDKYYTHKSYHQPIKRDILLESKLPNSM